jgi:protein-S-isoprenylcysteine O-methyltransferase Ste14
MISLKILITSVISVAIQFGLAIAGWGGWNPFFAHPAFRALAWVVAVLSAAAMFSGGGLSTGEKEDRGNRWVLGAFTLIALLMAYFSAYTDRIGFWVLDGDAMRWTGVALCAAGGVLRLWPVFVLRNRFSGLVAIQPGHELETRGIYSLTRNPSYLGLVISSLGWVLAFRSMVGVLLTASMLVPSRGAVAARTLRHPLRGIPRPHVAAGAGNLLSQKTGQYRRGYRSPDLSQVPLSYIRKPQGAKVSFGMLSQLSHPFSSEIATRRACFLVYWAMMNDNSIFAFCSSWYRRLDAAVCERTVCLHVRRGNSSRAAALLRSYRRAATSHRACAWSHAGGRRRRHGQNDRSDAAHRAVAAGGICEAARDCGHHLHSCLSA